jgi:glycosyltransferase involved in cell wall biosynthesis
MKPKISIIITAHNYAKYLADAIDSAVNQNYDSFEVIVVNDGSTDHTDEILANYKEKVIIINLPGVGLAKACNKGIAESSGDYLIRLDADDYFDDNMLLVLASFLDRNPNIHLAYPDFYEIDSYGEILRLRRYGKVNQEVKLLDRSPLAAGAMFRRSCFEKIGGYREELRYQEDYDFWIRFTERFNVQNINLPLMYYRKHGKSMSDKREPRLDARRYVKEKILEKRKIEKPNVLAVIPARSTPFTNFDINLKELDGNPVIYYTIKEALDSDMIDRTVVSTENSDIAKTAERIGAEIPFLRPAALSMQGVQIGEVIKDILKKLYKEERYEPDLVVSLQVNSPFRKVKHIDEAINTQLIHNTDSVISVYEDLSFHWCPGENGLRPVIFKERMLRKEKEIVYRENGSIYLYKTKNLLMDMGMGDCIGHIEMTEKDSFRIMDDFDLWMAEKIMQKRKAEE